MKHLKKFNENIDNVTWFVKDEEMDLLKEFSLYVSQMENDRSSLEVQEKLAQELLDGFFEYRKNKYGQ